MKIRLDKFKYGKQCSLCSVWGEVIAAIPKVKQRVRAVARQDKFSVWLPTSTDYFYPDFLAELVAGRVLAVEYKSEPYRTNDDSREKQQVGHQWGSPAVSAAFSCLPLNARPAV